ncbi:MAG: cell division protein ZapA [Bacteroidetes bacterium]|nr:cell division protein ZapA [Bacteroidota bacterium]MDA1332831.1 cell division protein ZapA [Bacteroidota bacterium]
MANLTPIKIRLLGKDYTLRVAEEDELATLEMAEYLDKKLTTFKKAHPEQSDLTAAVITGLAITEELFIERASSLDPGEHVNGVLTDLEKKLSKALLS